MYLSSSERLGRHDLAALLKVLVDLEYKHPTNSYERLFDNARDLQGIFITDEQREQVEAAVAAVPPDALRRNGQPSRDGATSTYTITTAGRAHVPLDEMLYHAWVRMHGSADDERIVVLAEEPDGLLLPDPRDKDLDGLGIADVFFLVAHDRHDGRPLLAPMVLACGTAAALLAELLLHNLLAIDLSSHQVDAALGNVAGVTALSVTARQAFEVIQDGDRATLGHWLSVLAANGYRAVHTHLRHEGIVRREEQGRWRKTVCFTPADPGIVDSVFRVATFRLQLGRQLEAPYAVLIELARVTGLMVNRHGDWWGVHHIDPGGALVEVPRRERFDLLLALTRAAITELLNSPGL